MSFENAGGGREPRAGENLLTRIPVKVDSPPPKAPEPLVSFLYKPFNNKEHAFSLSRSHENFLDSRCTASNPTPSETQTHLYCVKRIYKTHQRNDNMHVSAGEGVYDTSGLCPPLCATNSNIFASTFGIESDNGAATFVRPIASYEVTKYYPLHDNLTFVLAHPENFLLLDYGIPT